MSKLVSVLLCFTLVVSVLAGPSDPVPRTDGDWQDRHWGFVTNSLANPRIPVVFFGDSITDMWTGSCWNPNCMGQSVFNQYYAPLGVANYGIGGDGIQHVLWRVINGEVNGLSPKAVVVKIGINNILFGGDSNSEIVRGIETLVNAIRQRLPNTKILLLGILPSDWNWTGGNEVFTRTTDINTQIARLHNGSTVFFLDMFWNFAEVWGTVPQSLFIDGLHLTTAGYRRWAETMAPLFNQLIA